MTKRDRLVLVGVTLMILAAALLDPVAGLANHYILCDKSTECDDLPSIAPARPKALAAPQVPDAAQSFPQPDGKTFFVWSAPLDPGNPSTTAAFAIWKRNADGTPDTTFNGNGFVSVPIWGYDEGAGGLAVQPDGRIVVAGGAIDPACPDYTCWEPRTAIVRLNPDGTLDPSFNGDGMIAIVMTYAGGGITASSPYPTPIGSESSFNASDVALLDDGTIEIRAGEYPVGNTAYVRVRADGTLEGGPVENVFGRFTARETLLVRAQGLWHAEAEPGWGISFAQQGEIIVATWFTYDASGRGVWYSMAATRTWEGVYDGEAVYSGELFESAGPGVNAPSFDRSLVMSTRVGSGKLTFSDRDHARFDYVVGTVSGTKAITRQAFGPLPMCSFGTLDDLARATNFQDLWWASPPGSESGWGLSLAHEGDTIFALWLTYDLDGKPLWLSGTASRALPGVFAGNLLRSSGPPFDTNSWNPEAVAYRSVGSFTLTFSDGNAGIFSYRLALGSPLQTIAGSKAITREVFVQPGTTCR